MHGAARCRDDEVSQPQAGFFGGIFPARRGIPIRKSHHQRTVREHFYPKRRAADRHAAGACGSGWFDLDSRMRLAKQQHNCQQQRRQPRRAKALPTKFPRIHGQCPLSRLVCAARRRIIYTFVTHMGEINDIGGISLSLFQGIVMITLPLLLAGQTVLMFVFARYAVFNIIGRDYDAAVLSSGICGFDMGATTNAMANMQALSCSGRNEPTRSGSAATVWSRRNLLCRRSTPAAPTRTLPPRRKKRSPPRNPSPTIM